MFTADLVFTSLSARVDRLTDQIDNIRNLGIGATVGLFLTLGGAIFWTWSDTRAEIKDMRDQMTRIETVLVRIEGRLDKIEYRQQVAEDRQKATEIKLQEVANSVGALPSMGGPKGRPRR